MAKVFLLTGGFPYGHREQFLEHEMPFWKGKNLTVFPVLKEHGLGVRKFDYVEVNECLNVGSDKIRLAFPDLLWLIVDSQFWNEALRGAPGLRLAAWRSLLIDTVLSNRLTRKILKNHAIFGPGTVVYSYWSNWILRGAAMAKRRNPECRFTLVSRCHRVDLYAYARPGNYFPYGHNYHPYVDGYFPVSEDGEEYLKTRYGIPQEKIEVSRLGVPDKSISVDSSIEEVTALTLISVSYAKKVKRIDRIIDALALLRGSSPDLKIAWTHVGDGPELQSLKKRAEEKNVQCDWKGLMPNTHVLELLAKHSNAIFINVSDSEGVPVSIMEAMSFGIPVVATDVGGSREVVCDGSGVLIDEPFSVRKVADSIQKVARSGPSFDQVRNVFLDRCSTKNFEAFVDRVQAVQSQFSD